MPASGATDGTILVTGASGLAGSAVIREFVRNGYPVRALVRSRAKAHAFQAFPGCRWWKATCSRPQTLEDALSGVDRVLLISSSDQQMAQRQSRFIDAARKADVRHIVKFSGLTQQMSIRPLCSAACTRTSSAYLKAPGSHGPICARASS